ncbi:unnamed protein product [Dovyalis caffra]|uniref:Chlororespiratory reduction 21 n=1 Tax=Dovyalis caffra TaxID=77055 RepID=A0AAV1S613_9ROSI|nr:unnamed protein product [Dovyalis caffra]
MVEMQSAVCELFSLKLNKKIKLLGKPSANGVLSSGARVDWHHSYGDHCFSLKSLSFARITHAQLIKVGFNRHTFLGNRCLDLYSKFGNFNDALKVFDDISAKNIISWNICLKALLKFDHLDLACSVFDEMPERDVVGWNSMISGYASCGYFDCALGTFWEMQNWGVRPSGFTYSILMSLVFGVRHGKEIHGSITRSGLGALNVVLGNSLIDMYGKLGSLDYALGVFLTMEELDVISWNSLISVCCKSGYPELALDKFCLMRSFGYSPDEFSVSVVITSCSNLRNLEKGKQIFALCVKVGFLCNTIISSATIDLFSKCNRLKDSVRLFEEQDQWDSALCNSMISSYAWEDIKPTEFTVSSVLHCISILQLDQGTQVHSLAVKSGLELDAIVASSLVEMYSELGFIDCAMRIFNKMIVRDLITWNTMIMGLTHNGSVFEALQTFKELLWRGLPPDRITLAGVLLACSFGVFIKEGMAIFSSMEERYGVTPSNEHYACLVNLLCRAGMLDEALDVAGSMPYEPGSLIWESILHACLIHGDLKLSERVAERLIELEPHSSLPYLVLARMYEVKGQWEGVVRVKKAMKRERVEKVIGCSWIGVKNQVHTFKADQLQHHGGKEIYLVLRLLNWEMEANSKGTAVPVCVCLKPMYARLTSILLDSGMVNFALKLLLSVALFLGCK